MMYERRYVTITGSDDNLRILQIADETGLDANLVAEKVKELFHEAEERGDLKDGQLVVGYLAQVPDIMDNLDSAMVLKLQEVDKMCYAEPLLLPAKPEFLSTPRSCTHTRSMRATESPITGTASGAIPVKGEKPVCQ